MSVQELAPKIEFRASEAHPVSFEKVAAEEAKPISWAYHENLQQGTSVVRGSFDIMY